MTKEQLARHRSELQSLAANEAKLCLPRHVDGENNVRMGVLAAEVGLTVLAAATDGYGTGLLVAGIFAVANRLHNGNKKKEVIPVHNAEDAAAKAELVAELDALSRAVKNA